MINLNEKFKILKPETSQPTFFTKANKKNVPQLTIY